MYLIIILIPFCAADILEHNRMGRQLKEFENPFNNFLQQDFKITDAVPSYSEQDNRIKIVYKTVEEPIRIEKTIPVPVVKHIPQPIPIYVPRPYPVEKKVFVPYTVYEKQPLPIYYRYPVERKVPVPIHVPENEWMPYHVPEEKQLSPQIPIIPPPSYTDLKEIHPPKDELVQEYNSSQTVKFPEEKVSNLEKSALSEHSEQFASNNVKENPVNSGSSHSSRYFKKSIPYGTRLSSLNNNVETQVEHSEKDGVEIIKPLLEEKVKPAIPVSELVEDSNKENQITIDEDLKAGENKYENENSKEEKKIVVFPTESNITVVNS